MMQVRPAALLLASLLVLGCSGALGSRVAKVEVNDQVCDTCVVAVRILEDFLCDPAATDFALDIVEKQLCPSMPDVEECDQISEALVPVLVQWLRASATPLELCASAGVCGNSLAGLPHMAKAHKLKDGMECPVCEYVLNRVKSALADPVTQEQVKEAALAACNHLPTEMVDSCTSMVNTYEALLVMFVESADTQQACTFMGLCSGSLAAALKPGPLPVPLLRAMTASRLSLEKAAGLPPLSGPAGAGAGGRPLLGPGGLPPRHLAHPLLGAGPGPANGNGCDMCKLMVLEVHTLLENPDVQTSALTYIKSMCGQAPPDWQTSCTSMADTYVPLVFSALQNYVAEPDAVCQGMGVCPPPSALQRLVGALWGKSAAQLGQGMRLSEPLTELKQTVAMKQPQAAVAADDE